MMISHGMKTRRSLRAARVSALTFEERRRELRQAEERGARDDRDHHEVAPVEREPSPAARLDNP